MACELDDPLLCGYDEWTELFAAEVNYMAQLDEGDHHSRRHIVLLIRQMQCKFNLNSFVVYLAVNYVDRFLSCRRIELHTPHICSLLALSCLLLASKMKESHVGLRDLQRAEGFNFPATTVNRMELLVLQSLEWRMRSVTPFSFLLFFLALFSPFCHSPSIDALKSRASCIILNCQSDAKTMGYLPSVVAASALVVAVEELFPAHSVAFCSSVCSTNSVQNDALMECSTAIRKSPMINACRSKAGSSFCRPPPSEC